jgi:hypothetical protein
MSQQRYGDMPRIDDRELDGISLYIYHGGEDRHQPHFHAYYSGEAAVLSISTGDALAGQLAASQLRKIQRWLSVHRDEVMDRWSRAQRVEPIVRIRRTL